MEEFDGREIFDATEAEFDEKEHTATITIVKEGDSINGRNYKKSALKQAVMDRVYEGSRMFVDHSKSPPLKRSIKELVSGVQTTEYVEGKTSRIRGTVKFFDKDFEEFATRAHEHIGVSHDARLLGTRSRLSDGRVHEDIDQIKTVHSVDWVVYPSAGGGIESFYAQEGVTVSEAIDWGAITQEELEKNAPTLVTAIKATVKVDTDHSKENVEEVKDPKDAGTLDAKALQTLIKDTVKATVIEAQESIQKDAQNHETINKSVASVVDKSTLPDLTKARIKRQFTDVTAFDEDKVREAVEEAKKEVSAIAGPKVRNMGLSGTAGKDNKNDLGRAHEAVSSAFGIRKAPEKKKTETKSNGEEE